MTLNEFKQAKIEAMKQKDKEKVSALNVIITKIMSLTIEKRAVGAEVTEQDVDTLLQKAEKELTEEREGFLKAGREENVKSLTAQIEIIKQYLPKLLSEDEIKAVIEGLDDKTLPSIMKHFKQNYQGKADMRLVNAIAKNYN